MQDLDLAPDSRSYHLREMYWQREQEQYRVCKALVGSGKATLVGKAQDFATVLQQTPLAIQPLDMLAGVITVEAVEGSTIDLGHYDGHYTPGHAKLICMGYTGIRDRAQEKLTYASDPSKRDFLQATVIAYDAACRFAQRHALNAHALAAESADPGRRAELLRIAEACHQIAIGPPASFHAALQMMWFAFMFGARGSIGRFDQWMVPLYRRDIDAGRITHEEAQELLENYFVKLNYFAGDNDSLRNIALAGQTPAGEDAYNTVSAMCLVASSRLMLPEPKLNVRFFDGSPRELLELSCRLTCRGLSNPAYFNDNVAIPGLLRLGIPLEDARDYCNDGCSEVILGGKSTISFKNFDTLPMLNQTVQRGAQEAYASFGRDNKGPQE